MKKIATLSLITTSLLLGASPAVPTSSDIQREVEPPKDLPKKATPLVEVGGVQKYAPMMKDDKSGKTIFVKNFKITAAIHMPESELQTLLADFTNKDLTFAQLQEAASVITKEYRANGFFVTRAYIPAQKMQDGIVEIAIIEGNYGKFILDNSSRVSTPRVQAMLDNVKDANIVSTATLERAMLIINDTPGAKVTAADVMPGAEVGTSDFAVKTEATPLYDGYVIGDNYGSRYTGQNRLMAGVNFNSLAGIGDKLSLSGLVSKEADLTNYRVGYAIPLMPNGLTGEVAYSMTKYALTEEYADLNAEGTSNALEATLSYPLIRTRLETLKIHSTLAKKDLTDKLDGDTSTDKDVVSLNLGLTHTKDQMLLGLNTQIKSNLTLTHGSLNFADDASRTADEAGAQTAGTYNKLGGYVNATVQLPYEFALQTNLQFQKAMGMKNLDGSEDMSIGGSNGVKVYPDGELSAENAIMLNIELFKALPTFANYSHKVGLFYDAAKADMQDNKNDTTFESRTLQDVGIGYYANYNSLFAKAQLATVVGNEDILSEPNDNTRALVQLGWMF